MKKYILFLLFPVFVMAASTPDALDSIKIPTLNFKEAPLVKVVGALNIMSKDADPSKKGIRLLIEDPDTMLHSVTVSANNISYRAALDLILRGSAFNYSIEGNVIVIGRKGDDSRIGVTNSNSNVGFELIEGRKKESVYVIEVQDSTTGISRRKVGTGFLAKIKNKSFVVTNQHVVDGVSDESELTILNLRGEKVKTGRAWAAVDHDFIMIEVLSDVAGSYHFEFHPDLQQIKRGDSVLAVGNPLGGGTLLEARGSVVGLGPRKVELDISVFGGNSGGPVIHTNSGFVLGIVTEGRLVGGDVFTQISKDRSDSPIKSDLRIFSTRFDSVSKWEEISWQDYSVSQPRWAGQNKQLAMHVKRLLAFWAIAGSSADPFTSNRDKIIEIPEIWNAFQRYERDNVRASSTEQRESNLQFMVMTIDAYYSPRGQFRSELNKAKSFYYSWNQDQRTSYPYSIEYLEEAYTTAYKLWTLNRETVMHQIRLRKDSRGG